MSGRIERVYWDSNIFLSILKDEERSDEEQQGLLHYSDLIARGQVLLMTSTITRVEVLDATLDEGQRKKFMDFFNVRDTYVYAPDVRIAEKASAIRSYYKRDDPNAKTVCTPDAIHLATAIHFRADQFHTFDKKNKHGSLGLLKLGDQAGEYSIRICTPPPAPQSRIDLRP